MKFLKNNLKTILAVSATAIICISGTAFAALQYQANSVSYTTAKNANIKNVEDALNDLYNINKNTKEITLYSNSYNQTGDSVCCGLYANNGIKKITIKNITYNNTSFRLGWFKIGNEESQSFPSISVGDSFEINNNAFLLQFYAKSTTKYGELKIDLLVE